MRAPRLFSSSRTLLRGQSAIRIDLARTWIGTSPSPRPCGRLGRCRRRGSHRPPSGREAPAARGCTRRIPLTEVAACLSPLAGSSTRSTCSGPSDRQIGRGCNTSHGGAWPSGLIADEPSTAFRNRHSGCTVDCGRAGLRKGVRLLSVFHRLPVSCWYSQQDDGFRGRRRRSGDCGQSLGTGSHTRPETTSGRLR